MRHELRWEARRPRQRCCPSGHPGRPAGRRPGPSRRRSDGRRPAGQSGQVSPQAQVQLGWERTMSLSTPGVVEPAWITGRPASRNGNPRWSSTSSASTWRTNSSSARSTSWTRPRSTAAAPTTTAAAAQLPKSGAARRSSSNWARRPNAAGQSIPGRFRAFGWPRRRLRRVRAATVGARSLLDNQALNEGRCLVGSGARAEPGLSRRGRLSDRVDPGGRTTPNHRRRQTAPGRVETPRWSRGSGWHGRPWPLACGQAGR
jgi:hypothetical protein